MQGWFDWFLLCDWRCADCYNCSGTYTAQLQGFTTIHIYTWMRDSCKHTFSQVSSSSGEKLANYMHLLTFYREQCYACFLTKVRQFHHQLLPVLAGNVFFVCVCVCVCVCVSHHGKMWSWRPLSRQELRNYYWSDINCFTRCLGLSVLLYVEWFLSAW